MTPTMSNPAALNPDALRAAMIAGEAECREYGFRGPHDGIYEVAIRAYLSALPAPSAVAGDGLVERLLSDDPFGDPFSSEKNAKEAASRITELQAKVARMEVEAFDAATAHGKTKLALAKSEASREAAEARVEGLVEDLIAELEERITLHGDDMGDTIAGRIAQLRAARTWTECGR